MLNLLILLPFAAAILILLGSPARKTALIAAIGQFLVSAFAFLSYDRAKAGFQFVQRNAIVPAWDFNYFLAADGLSVVMLLLTGLVTAAAVWMAPSIERRQGLFYSCLLLISAGCAGAFAAQDLFFFYAFHELALIPTFLLIGIWGSGERHSIAWKVTIYLALGSFILLIGLVDLYQSLPAAVRTFDMVKLQQLGSQAIPAGAQTRPFLFLLVGFGILISLFPFHTWAPSAYASAPAPAAMLHAGVLKKFGLYGLFRLAVPLLPEGAKQPVFCGWSGIDILLVLLVGNILYVGLATIAQRKLDLMLGYSSVMHMGYIFLGLAAMNVIGLSGAALLMFAHGLSIAALFAMTGMIREKQANLSFDSLGGLAKPLPSLGVAFGLAAFASIGLPGFGNFSSEVMVFFGAFKNGPAGLQFSAIQIATICALWGVVISAVYMLRGYRRIFLGEPEKPVAAWENPSLLARWPVLLLLAVLMLAGFAPNYFLSFIRPTVEALLR